MILELGRTFISSGVFHIIWPRVQWKPSWQLMGISPEVDLFIVFAAISSATNEVATLRRGMLKTFDTMLKIDMETPADANSSTPIAKVMQQKVNSVARKFIHYHNIKSSKERNQHK